MTNSCTTRIFFHEFLLQDTQMAGESEKKSAAKLRSHTSYLRPCHTVRQIVGKSPWWSPQDTQIEARGARDARQYLPDGDGIVTCVRRLTKPSPSPSHNVAEISAPLAS